VNRQREHRHKQPVEYVDELNEIAAEYADRMALSGELSHKLGDTTARDRAEGWSQVVENIHRNESVHVDNGAVARNTVQSWLNSPSHRKNMLREQLSAAGVGVAQSGDWVYVCLLLSTGKKAHVKAVDRVSSWIRG
jgi:uncharacterized protein YkwD